MPHSEPEPDDLILLLLAQDDARAIEKLHALYYERLFYGARKLINNDHEAASVVNDLLISVWQKRSVLNLRKPLLRYLYRAVHNRALNFLRNKSRVKEIPLQPEQFNANAEEVSEMTADHALVAEDLLVLWTLAEQHMTHRVRQTFLLSRQAGKTKEEIAEIMGITINAVEKNIARAWGVIERIRKHYFVLLGAAVVLCP